MVELDPERPGLGMVDSVYVCAPAVGLDQSVVTLHPSLSDCMENFREIKNRTLEIYEIYDK